MTHIILPQRQDPFVRTKGAAGLMAWSVGYTNDSAPVFGLERYGGRNKWLSSCSASGHDGQGVNECCPRFGKNTARLHLQKLPVNLLELELFFLILAHPVYKM